MTLPAVVTILDLASGILSTTAVLEAQFTSGGVATTIQVTPFQIVSAAFSAGMVVPVPFGGTGTSTLTANGIVYGNGTSAVGVFNGSGLIHGNGTAALTAIAPGTAFWPLVGNGSTTLPSFQQLNLTASALTGVLGVPFGGSGTTELAANQVMIGNGTAAVQLSGAATTGFALLGNGTAAPPTFQQIGTAALSGVVWPVPNGGTGTSALAANQVVIGNGTAAVQFSGVATSGLVLTGNGTATSPTFQSIGTAALSGVVWSVPQGGTNTSTLTLFGMMFGNGTSTVGITAAGATALALLGNGTAVAPSFQLVNLTASITGVLGVPNGGTGTSILTANGVVVANGTAAFTAIAPATTGFLLTARGTALSPTYQQLDLSTTVTFTGILTVPFGGVGLAAYSAGDLIAASNATTLARVAAATAGFFVVSTGTASAPSYAVARPMLVASRLTANFTTTTGTLIDVPGGLVSFTLPATSVVSIMFQGPLSMNTGAQGLLALNIDSVDTNVLLAAAVGTNALTPATLIYNTTSPLSPATHTVKLRARTSDGSSQITMNFASISNGLLQILAVATG